MGTPLRQVVFDIGGGAPAGHHMQGRADRRADRRLHPRGAAGRGHRLRHASGTRRHDGLRRHGRDGRAHLHGGRGQVLHGVHPERDPAASACPAARAPRRMLEILEASPSARWATRCGGSSAFRGILHLEELAETDQGHLTVRPRPDRAPTRCSRRCGGSATSTRRTSWRASARPVSARVSASTASIPPSAPAAPSVVKSCPSGAIVGERKKAHYIIVDRCMGCGACADACPKQAVAAVA